MKVLAFSFFPAFVPPENGGVTRLFRFYRALSRWHEVRLITSTHVGGREEVVRHGAGFLERRVPKGPEFVAQWEALQPKAGEGDLSGPCLAACATRPSGLHRAYLEEYAWADVILHDFPFLAGYDLFAGGDDKPRIYNAHNCESALYRQLHGARGEAVTQVVEAAERHVLSFADVLFYCSREDLEGFRSLAPQAGYEAVYVPHGAEVPVQGRAARPGGGAPRAVFVGSSHPPNVAAARFIVETLAPSLPQVHFDLVGGCWPQGRYGASVSAHGVVDSLRLAQLLEEADVALNPMLEGGGSNVKVLDYFAHGLPVVSTPFGMRGVEAEPGVHFVSAPLEEFAQALSQILADGARLEALGAAARALVQARYRWEAVAERAAAAIEAAVRRKRAQDRRFVLALNDYDSFAAVGGGGTRTRALYEAVSAWRPVIFLSLGDPVRIEAVRHGEGILGVRLPKTEAQRLEEDRARASGVSQDDVIAARHALRNPWLVAAYEALRQRAACISVEHCYLTPLPLSFGDRFVYSSQNHEAGLKARLLGALPGGAEAVAEVARLERLAVMRAATVVAVSEEDARALVRGLPAAAPVVVVRNGAQDPAEGQRAQEVAEAVAREVGARSAVFLGSAHPPNVEAGRFVLALARRCPDVEFHVLGSVCDALEGAARNVRLWGQVDEETKSAVLRACRVALNPMREGSGSNVKLADYLAHGLFVVTTDFGRRGYPPEVGAHLAVVPLEDFARTVQAALADEQLFSSEVREQRRVLFDRLLSMRRLARRFMEVLQGLEAPKKRVLVVTYRYGAPARGGAEAYLERCLQALAAQGDFAVDVVAPEVSRIEDRCRFTANYVFEEDFGVPVDLPGVRFARFPVRVPEGIAQGVRAAWAVQPRFEEALAHRLAGRFSRSGLSWGWGYPETGGRWAMTECAVFLAREGVLRLRVRTEGRVVVWASCEEGSLGGPWVVEGGAELVFMAPAGEVCLTASAAVVEDELRPVGMLVTGLHLAGEEIALAGPTLVQEALQGLPAVEAFACLAQAAQESRGVHAVELTPLRGPWSPGLEAFVREHARDYDLVVTHNVVFRPAVVAVRAARDAGVPAVVIPHAHLDDDFYHFPDLAETLRTADLVLASPRAACDFLQQQGCRTAYLPAGCDTTESFGEAEVAAFRAVCDVPEPFVLVLGRKAGAKGYRAVIEAVEALNREGVRVRAVLIGPDDDGVPVRSAHAVYLGPQPREVVRGALASCTALCHLSASESFGIVLLEAWQAGRPVIVNRHCAAFHDMAIDGVNALMVSPDQGEEVKAAIARLIGDPELAVELAREGRKVVEDYSWQKVGQRFVEFCRELIGPMRNEFQTPDGAGAPLVEKTIP